MSFLKGLIRPSPEGESIYVCGDKTIMNKMNFVAAVVGISIALAGCGGREAKPIAITNPTDSAFDCAGISREFAANERQITVTLKERSQAQGKNIVLGAAGVLFLPALFSWTRSRLRRWRSMRCAIATRFWKILPAPRSAQHQSHN